MRPQRPEDFRNGKGGQEPGVTKESDPRPERDGKAAAQLDLLLLWRLKDFVDEVEVM